MLGILYLLLAWFVGYQFLIKLMPWLFKIPGAQSLSGRPIPLGKWEVALPAAFLVGTLLMCWLTYMGAYLFAPLGSPMLYGNLIAFAVMGIIFVRVMFVKRGAGRALQKENLFLKGSFYAWKYKQQILFSLIVFTSSLFIMNEVMQYKNGAIYVGWYFFGDIFYHLPITYSFAMGTNFPTTLPVFPNGHIIYHFLFYFLSGNLLFLGLNLNDASNLLSALDMTSFILLLYAFSVCLTGNRYVGYMTIILFYFRSSFAFFTYVSQFCTSHHAWIFSNFKIFNEFIENTVKLPYYIGQNITEGWGLWDFAQTSGTQRHNSLSFGILMIVLMYTFLFLSDKNTLQAPTQRSSFKKEFFPISNIKASAVVGFILGLTFYWNGVAVFTTCLLLLFFCCVSKYRGDFLIILGVTFLLGVLEKIFFAGLGPTFFQPGWFVGFVSRKNDFWGILAFYIEFLGILPFTAILSVYFFPKEGRWIVLANFILILLATVFCFSGQVINNYKIIMIAIILLNILVANFLVVFFSSKNILKQLIATCLLILLTITGIVEVFPFYNMEEKKDIVLNLYDPARIWILNYVNPKDIFLTGGDPFFPALLAGRKDFLNIQAFVGYNADQRAEIARKIYAGDYPDYQSLEKVLLKNHLRYLVLDNDVRQNTYVLFLGGPKIPVINIPFIQKHFKLVFEDKNKNLQIYQTY